MKNRISYSHLLWIPTAGLVGFLVSFLFGDLLVLPVDLYYLIYFSIIGGFVAYYVRKTNLDLQAWMSRRLLWAIGLGVAVGLLMMQNALSRPATERFSGLMLGWAVFWRGLVYGAVDGLLLFAFPWIVTWRALQANEKGLVRKIGAGLLTWAAILLVTTTYHLGYEDFRSEKILRPNIGSTITAASTILTANPAASPISHVFLHVTAVIHCPETELFLPPHRE